jgi:hypothetical protein
LPMQDKSTDFGIVELRRRTNICGPLLCTSFKGASHSAHALKLTILRKLRRERFARHYGCGQAI